MAGRNTKLTPELQERLISYIRGGAFDYVAAQAVGISRNTFYRWYNAGANPRSRYASFRGEVNQARAQARVVAETSVFRAKPESWLKNGPGRERPGAPGWTNPAQSWREQIDKEAAEAAAERIAARLNLDPDELLKMADILSRQVDRLLSAAGDPDLFIEQPTG